MRCGVGGGRAAHCMSIRGKIGFGIIVEDGAWKQGLKQIMG